MMPVESLLQLSVLYWNILFFGKINCCDEYPQWLW